MHRLLLATAFILLATVCVTPQASLGLARASAVNATLGATCSKAGAISNINGVKLKCYKSGKKLLWIRISKIVDFYDAPAIETVDPITFENIASRIDDISQTVWQNAQDVIANNMNLPGAKTSYKIYHSPNMEIGFYKDAGAWMERVNSLYANFALPVKTYLYFTTAQDLGSTYREVLKTFAQNWATDMKEIYGSGFYGKSANCVGTSPIRAHTQLPELIGMIFAGSCKNGERELEGQVVHEYAHQVQEAQLWNGQRTGRNIVEPCWMIEGQVVLTSMVERQSFQEYLDIHVPTSRPEYGTILGDGYVQNPKINWTKKFVMNYFKKANVPGKCTETKEFSLSASVGFLTVEALSAIRGIESHMSFEQRLGSGVPFNKAFLNTFGITWKKAAPILAEVVAAQMAIVNN